jgi:hypothetical protein
MSGAPRTNITPRRPIKEPVISFFLGFSLRKKREKRIIKTGAELPMSAALMLGARSNP